MTRWCTAKASLIGKMPDPYENKFGGLRALYGYMAAHPGKKMLFMGGEFAQFSEWAYQRGLDWMLLDYPAHKQMQTYVKALNHFYLETPQLWEQDTDWRGFEWISHEDNRNNIIAFRRIATDGSDIVDRGQLLAGDAGGLPHRRAVCGQL